MFLLSLGVRDSLCNTILAMILSLVLENNDGFIHRAEILSWSWKWFWCSISHHRSLIHDLLVGIAIGLIFAGQQLSQGNRDSITSTNLVTGLLITLALRLVYAVVQGISNQNLDDRQRARTNKGIRCSFSHSLAGGLIGTCAAIIFSIFTCLFTIAASNGLSSFFQSGAWLASAKLGLSNSLLLGPCGCLLGWLLCGGLASLQHSILRLILWHTKALPLSISHFLDHATQSILLNKVDGGYTFVHPLLFEYFVSLDKQTQSEELIPIVSRHLAWKGHQSRRNTERRNRSQASPRPSTEGCLETGL
jgi:hypothetical protein